MADRRSGFTTGARDLDFIAENPAMAAYDEREKIALARKAAELAIDSTMQQNAERSAGMPSRLRTLTAGADTAESTARVNKGTEAYKIDDAYENNRTNRSNANVTEKTEGDRIATSGYTTQTAGANARTAASNANVTVATEPNRITQSNDATRTGGANADVAVQTAPIKVEQSRQGLRRDQLANVGTELTQLKTQLDMIDAGRVDEAKMMAAQSGREIPQHIIDNAELRTTLKNVIAVAEKRFPNRPQDQQAFIKAHMDGLASGATTASSPATPYTQPPGAPEPQEDTNRSYYEWVEGEGIDPATGQRVKGTWKVDRYAGTQEFTPGDIISSRGARGGGAGKDPANVATAKWLIDKGIAATPEQAWQMVTTSKSNPQAMATQVYNAALRSTFGNVEKAKVLVNEWQKLNATQPMAPAPQARPATAPAAPAAPGAQALPAPRDPSQRVLNQVYLAADGRKVKWVGNGWEVVP
jgi:hypothetical protein